MKKFMAAAALGLALMSGGGCFAITPEDRAAIIEAASRRAGDEAAKLAEASAVKLGLSAEAARVLAEEARKKAEETAAALAAKATDKVAEEKGSTAGKLGATIFGIIMQLGLGIKLGPKEG